MMIKCTKPFFFFLSFKVLPNDYKIKHLLLNIHRNSIKYVIIFIIKLIKKIQKIYNMLNQMIELLKGVICSYYY